MAQECSKEIEWKADYLHISKYISSTTGELLQVTEGESKPIIIELCRNHLEQIFHSEKEDYFRFLSINLLDDVGRYFTSDP